MNMLPRFYATDAFFLVTLIVVAQAVLVASAALLNGRRRRLTKIGGKTIPRALVMLVAPTLIIAGSCVAVRAVGSPVEKPPPTAAPRKDQAANQTAERVKFLTRALADPDERVRRAAIEALGDTRHANAVPPLIQLTGDPDDNIRHLAIQALTRIRDKRALKAFTASLVDQNSQVRIAAARGLGDLADERAVPALVTALSDDVDNVRITAFEALGKIGDPAVEDLGRLLSRGPSTRARAADLLLKVGTPKAIQALKTAAEHENWRIRLSAFQALARTAKPPMDLAQKGIDDENATIRRTAVDILRRHRHVAANVATLIRAMKSPDKEVRRTAVEALRESKDARLIGTFCELLRDPDVGVRRAAADGLARSASPKSLPALAAGIHDKDQQVRQHVLRALEAIGGEKAVVILAEATQDRDPSMRAQAVRSYSRAAGNKGADLLIRALQDEDRQVRRHAVEELSKIGGKDVARALGAAAIRDDDPEVVSRAAYILTRMDGAHVVEPLCAVLARATQPDVPPALRQRRADIIHALGRTGNERASAALRGAMEDSSSSVRATAATALGKIPGEAAAEAVIAALKDPHLQVRRAAALTLAERPNPRATEALIAALNDSHVDIRRVAARALGQIGNDQAAKALLAAAEGVTDSKLLWDIGLALARAAPEKALKTYTKALQTRYSAPWKALAEVITESGKTDVVEALIAALKAQDVNVRRLAAGQLGFIGDPRAVEPLKKLLASTDRDTVAAARGALRDIAHQESRRRSERAKRQP